MAPTKAAPTTPVAPSTPDARLRAQNGFTFWGLGKPPRRPGDPLVALDRACEGYHGNVEALVKDGVTDENRSKVVAAIRKHAQVIEPAREGRVMAPSKPGTDVAG
ncbi:MAG: hypothetical protein LH467_07660 [Gemmatimonadaceae bacterium]|nr:hypothetical protein [Gemmatimonadaceae bacterium]